VSGFVLIAESHISIHTFPEKQYLSMDLLSCQQFDVELVLRIMRESFGIAKLETNLLARGTEFPKEISRASRLARREREALGPAAALAGPLAAAPLAPASRRPRRARAVTPQP
jgi:S-adenosylmethionine decarboxylase